MAKKTIAEQISAFEATRAAKAARMTEMMETAGDTGETLNAEQQQEYDSLVTDLKAVDDHLGRLHVLEKMAENMSFAMDEFEREAERRRLIDQREGDARRLAEREA